MFRRGSNGSGIASPEMYRSPSFAYLDPRPHQSLFDEDGLWTWLVLYLLFYIYFFDSPGLPVAPPVMPTDPNEFHTPYMPRTGGPVCKSIKDTPNAYLLHCCLAGWTTQPRRKKSDVWFLSFHSTRLPCLWLLWWWTVFIACWGTKIFMHHMCLICPLQEYDRDLRVLHENDQVDSWCLVKLRTLFLKIPLRSILDVSWTGLP